MNLIKKNLHKIISACFVLVVIFLPVVLFAVEPECIPTAGKICNPIPSITSIAGFINVFLTGALRIGIPVAALAIIYSGFLFVFARGNSEKLTTAKDTLLYTLIGTAILLGAWAIAELISTTVTGLAA
jgi:hypothetical protein